MSFPSLHQNDLLMSDSSSVEEDDNLFDCQLLQSLSSLSIQSAQSAPSPAPSSAPSRTLSLCLSRTPSLPRPSALFLSPTPSIPKRDKKNKNNNKKKNNNRKKNTNNNKKKNNKKDNDKSIAVSSSMTGARKFASVDMEYEIQQRYVNYVKDNKIKKKKNVSYRQYRGLCRGKLTRAGKQAPIAKLTGKTTLLNDVFDLYTTYKLLRSVFPEFTQPEIDLPFTSLPKDELIQLKDKLDTAILSLNLMSISGG
eukprot:m.79817 g.79817  ORF g.79817 m.79817 type:complete len:252 (+) comp14181_c0_seq2:143-898(+)